MKNLRCARLQSASTRSDGTSLALPKALVAGEEEQLVLYNRAADVGAKLVLGKRRDLRPALVGEEVVRVQHFIAQELVCGTMERVGARLGNEVDDSAGKSAVFRAQIVGLDFEFLDGILRRYHGDHVQIRSVGRHAVDQDLALSSHASANLKISQGERIGADGVADGGIATEG